MPKGLGGTSLPGRESWQTHLLPGDLGLVVQSSPQPHGDPGLNGGTVLAVSKASFGALHLGSEGKPLAQSPLQILASAAGTEPSPRPSLGHAHYEIALNLRRGRTLLC